MVPVGSIVFAEHQIFPKIGYTRYWSQYRQLTFSTPAIASWALGLLFGFGLNLLNVMSFYYLFIPTWIFTILMYTFLAGRYGAKNKYPEEEAKEKTRNSNIQKFQAQKAEKEDVIIKDTSLYTKVLKSISMLVLAITLVLGGIVLFGSETEQVYLENRELFYKYAFVCTVIYFTTSIWALKRGNSLNN